MEPLGTDISIIALVFYRGAFAYLKATGKQLINPSNLLILDISFIVPGIIFSDKRLIGYSFTGVGFLLSAIDATRNRKH
jgi:hypothetical protein